MLSTRPGTYCHPEILSFYTAFILRPEVVENLTGLCAVGAAPSPRLSWQRQPGQQDIDVGPGQMDLPDVELKQTRFYQDVFAEGRTEGRAEGQQQEAAAPVLRLLRRRLGAVSGEMEKRIRALPVADLEALGEAVLDWHAPAELIAWLPQQGERL